jgi:hypothetical protein
MQNGPLSVPTVFVMFNRKTFYHILIDQKSFLRQDVKYIYCIIFKLKFKTIDFKREISRDLTIYCMHYTLLQFMFRMFTSAL